jgi:hypothetical protein
MEYDTKYDTWGIRAASMRVDPNESLYAGQHGWRRGPRAVVGRMHYPLDLEAVEAKSKEKVNLSTLWTKDTDLDLFLAVDDVDVVLNREGLAYTDHTVRCIINAFKKVDEDIAKLTAKEFSGTKSLWDFCVRYRELMEEKQYQGYVWRLLKQGAKVIRDTYNKSKSIANPAGGMFPGDYIGDIGIFQIHDSPNFKLGFKAKRMGVTVETLKKEIEKTDADGTVTHHLSNPFDIHEWVKGAVGRYGAARERRQYTLSPAKNYAVVVIDPDIKPLRYFDRIQNHFNEHYGDTNWTVCVLHKKYNVDESHITQADIMHYIGFPKDILVIKWEDMLEPPVITPINGRGYGPVDRRALKVQEFNLDFVYHGWDQHRVSFNRMTHVVEKTLSEGDKNYYISMSRGQPLRDNAKLKFNSPKDFISRMKALVFDKVIPEKDTDGKPIPIYGISKSLLKGVKNRDNWVNIVDLAKEHYVTEQSTVLVPLKHAQIWRDWADWKDLNRGKKIRNCGRLKIDDLAKGLEFLVEDDTFEMDTLFGKVVAEYKKLRTAYIQYNRLDNQAMFWQVLTSTDTTQPETMLHINYTMMNGEWIAPYPMLHHLFYRGMWHMSGVDKTLERADIKHYIEMVDKERKSKP